MGIAGEVVAGADIGIGEIAASATGHQDLLAGFAGVVEHRDLPATFARFNGAHQASCAGTDDQHVCVNGLR